MVNEGKTPWWRALDAAGRQRSFPSYEKAERAVLRLEGEA